MAEKTILVGLIPEAMVIGPSDQVAWVAGEGQLKVEFDANRYPFASNILQAPAGMRLLSGTPRPGTKPGSFRYRFWLNDQMVGSGEIILRETWAVQPVLSEAWLLTIFGGTAYPSSVGRTPDPFPKALRTRRGTN